MQIAVLHQRNGEAMKIYKEGCWGNIFFDDGDVLDPLLKKNQDPISPQLIL